MKNERKELTEHQAVEDLDAAVLSMERDAQLRALAAGMDERAIREVLELVARRGMELQATHDVVRRSSR